MAFIPSSGSVVAFQSNPANLQASVTGTVAIAGSILTVGSGSVVAFQGNNPWVITGSVQASLTPAANQSVSGTVGASIIGLTPVAVTNTPSISGTVNVGNTVTINPPSVYGNISGSVVAFINNTPAVSVQGTVFVSGSVVTVGSAAPANQSVSGAVSVSNFPTTQNVSGSVVAFQGTNPFIITGSVQGTFSAGNSSVQVLNFPTNQSVSGSLGASIIGTVPVTQVTNPWTVTSSIAGGIFPISGSVAAVVTNNVTVVSSIAGGIFPISGSVAATIVGTPNVNVAGSVVAFQSAGWSGSVAATVTNTNLNVSGSVAAWLQSTNASVITVGTAAPNQSVSGTIQTDVRGSVATVIIGGSISATFTPPANQSVSGTVQTQVQASVAVVIIGGSILTSSTANQSVSGTVGSSIIGTVPVTQTTSPWIVNYQNSSIIAVSTGSVVTIPTGNQSISGTITVGSVLAMPGIVSTVNSTSTNQIASSVFTGTSEEWKDFGTITVNVFADAASATDGLSIQQSSNGTNWDITDTYTIPSMLAGQGKTFGIQPAARFGRVVYTNGTSASGQLRLQTVYHPQYTKPSSQRPSDGYTNESDLEQSQAFNMVYDDTSNTWYRMRGNSSIGTLVYTTSSIVARITGTPSISGTVNIAGNPSISGTVGASIIGQLPAGTAMLGSVIAYQGVTPWVTVPTSGSVIAVQGGTWSASVMTNVITSIATAGQVMGSVAALQATNPWIVTSSIAGGLFPITGSVAATIVGTPNVNTAGSVVAFQGTSPWVVAPNNSSLFALQPAGSILAVSGVSISISSVQVIGGSIISVPSGSVITVFQAPSIVGTYAEDAASASGDKGFLVMGARNDTLSSITSADGDYSSHVVGPAGELIAANSPFTKWVSGTGSMLGGTPVTGSLVPIIAAQGASVFTYITGLQIANASATPAWITLLGATNSVVGYTVAPANGGSNIYYQNGLKTNANAAFSASISAVASVYVSAQGFIAKI